MKEYSMALDYFQKCLAIVQKKLPAKHPSWGITYSNIGDVHRLMGDYQIKCFRVFIHVIIHSTNVIVRSSQ